MADEDDGPRSNAAVENTGPAMVSREKKEKEDKLNLDV